MVGTIQKASENKAALVEKKKPSAMQDYIKSMEREIAKALPSVITPERFTRITLSALSANPKLAQTTPQSFLAAMMNAAQLGVEPNTPLGQAYLIPYLNKGVLECQFQLGYKGLIDLANRSGEIISIEARVVYENDEFDFEYGLHSDLKHKPANADRGEPIWFYALFKTKDGGSCFEVSSVEDIRQHAKKYSQSYNSAYSPWSKNFEEMAKKTVLKAVLKYAPLKSDFVRALASDETIKTQIDKDMYEVPTAYVEADYSVTEENNQVAAENSQGFESGDLSNS